MKNLEMDYHFQEGGFNILAQSGTPLKAPEIYKEEIIVSGDGADFTNEEMTTQWAEKKMTTQKLMLSLIEVAEVKETPELIYAYRNTYKCLSKVYFANGKLYGKYCKNRFCLICCRIRKAELIHKYLPEISTWENAHFLTLTTKSVCADQLDQRINEMFTAFTKIKDKFRKWHTKGKSIKLMGVKSLECEFNPIEK